MIQSYSGLYLKVSWVCYVKCSNEAVDLSEPLSLDRDLTTDKYSELSAKELSEHYEQLSKISFLIAYYIFVVFLDVISLLYSSLYNF